MISELGRKMSQDLRNIIRDAARELPDISSSSFGTHFDQFGSSRLVLIGDARYVGFSYISIYSLRYSPLGYLDYMRGYCKHIHTDILLTLAPVPMLFHASKYHQI
jgi:hypothetical protein